MSKKTIIILVIVIIVLAVSFAAWYFTRKKNNPKTPETPEDKMFLKDQKGKIQVSPLLKEAITKVKIAGIKIPGMK